MKKVLTTLLELFGATRSDSAPGNCARRRYAPGTIYIFFAVGEAIKVNKTLVVVGF